MNKKELLLKREENLRHYHMQGMGNHVKRAKNAIYISPANSLEHEIAKLKACYQLLKEKKWFITEACSNKSKVRRDIVCLDDGLIIEIETDKKRAARFIKDEEKDNIQIVKLYEQTGGQR